MRASSVTMLRAYIFGKSLQKRYHIVSDKGHHARIRHVLANGGNSRRRALCRRAKRHFRESQIDSLAKPGMNPFKRCEKQQLLGVKSFVKGTVYTSSRLHQPVNGAHSQGHTAAPRFCMQRPVNPPGFKTGNIQIHVLTQNMTAIVYSVIL